MQKKTGTINKVPVFSFVATDYLLIEAKVEGIHS